MKYVISESRLEEVILKSIKRTIGEFRELHGDERYNPQPFESKIPFHYGFYKDESYTAVMTIIADSVALMIDEGYFDMIKSIFSLKDYDAREMIANVVKEYIHPYKVRKISIK